MRITAVQGVAAAIALAGCTSDYGDLAIQPAAAFDDVELECRTLWYGSDEYNAVQGKSASEQAIAKHDTIEKCVREMTAHMEGNADQGQSMPQKVTGSTAQQGAPTTAMDTDPRIHDDSWTVEWEKRWLCDGLTLYKSGGRGKVVLDGIGEISAQFTLRGLEPSWYWNDDDDREWDKENEYRYVLVIRRMPLFGNWVAGYYDFALADENGVVAEPGMTFHGCTN